MHNSLDILIAIKLILGWDVFFRSASAEFERRENVRSEFSSRLDAGVLGAYLRAEVAEGRRAFCRQKLGAEKLEENWLLKGKNVTKHQQLH